MQTSRRIFFRNLAIGGAALLTVRAMAHAGTTRTAAPAPADGGKTIYTCSMHPEVRQDRPGNCPICNMTLVKEKR
jgi:hypothetical protein